MKVTYLGLFILGGVVASLAQSARTELDGLPSLLLQIGVVGVAGPALTLLATRAVPVVPASACMVAGLALLGGIYGMDRSRDEIGTVGAFITGSILDGGIGLAGLLVVRGTAVLFRTVAHSTDSASP